MIIYARRSSSIRSFQTFLNTAISLLSNSSSNPDGNIPGRFLWPHFVSGKFAVASEVTFDLPLYRPLRPPQVFEKDSPSTQILRFLISNSDFISIVTTIDFRFFLFFCQETITYPPRVSQNRSKRNLFVVNYKVAIIRNIHTN